MELFVFVVLCLLLQPPFAAGAAFTTSGSCCSVVCHGQSRSCGHHLRPFFLNNGAVDKADSGDTSPNEHTPTSSTCRDLLEFQSDDDVSATTWSVSTENNNDDESDPGKALALDWCRQFLASIMNAAIEPIPNSNGMSVVRNIFDLETGITGSTILRNITIPFWQECINTVNIPRIRVAAVGTPGVGKTTSTSLLIRLLLEQGQKVVYLIRTLDKSSWYYELVPEVRRRAVTVNIYPEILTARLIPSNLIPSTYCIVDPGKSRDSCNPPDSFAAKVILVSSPNSRHWGESEFIKPRRGIRGLFKYFPTWSYDELLVARSILCANMTEDQLHDRFVQFGGVPRHVFELTGVDVFLLAQDNAVAALSAEIAKEIALGKMNAFDAFGKQTKSALLAFRLSGEDTGTFEKMESYIVSTLAFEKIYYKYRKELWNFMLDLGPNGGGGIIFELITRYMMAIRVPPMEFQCRRCVGKKEKEEYKNYFWQTLGTANKDIRQVMDPMTAATRLANVVFHPIIPNHELFDFVYKDLNGQFHVFQTTIGETHSANETNIKKLEKEVGGASNMTFYFLVPSKVFPTFVTNRRKPAVSCNIYHVSISSPWDQQRGAATHDEQQP